MVLDPADYARLEFIDEGAGRLWPPFKVMLLRGSFKRTGWYMGIIMVYKPTNTSWWWLEHSDINSGYIIGYKPTTMGIWWWFDLVGGLEPYFFSLSNGNVIIPTDSHIFQRGRYTTNQRRSGIWVDMGWKVAIKSQKLESSHEWLKKLANGLPPLVIKRSNGKSMKILYKLKSLGISSNWGFFMIFPYFSMFEDNEGQEKLSRMSSGGSPGHLSVIHGTKTTIQF